MSIIGIEYNRGCSIENRRGKLVERIVPTGSARQLSSAFGTLEEKNTSDKEKLD